MKKIFFLFALCNSIVLNSQVKPGLNRALNADDSTALITVATYPDSIKKNILEACLKPDFLVQTESLQKNTSKSFRNLIDKYSKDEQGKIWDLTRYPGLLAKITAGEKKSKEELETIASQYPQEIRPVIVEYGRKHYGVLSEINTLNENSNSDFEKIIAGYPEKTKISYRKLLNHPDVLNTLASNMHLSVILGNMYTADPKQTLNMLDSVKTVYNKQYAKDAQDWKEGLEKNPEAKKEMEQATKEFINEKENDPTVDDVYNTSPSNPAPRVYSNPPTTDYVVQPYPYWFGYPWWYDSPYWYPYPYWYNSGFYWGASGLVFIGPPSPFFMHWYFFHPYHHYYYSHFSDYSIGYHDTHYGPRFQRTGFNNEIHNWTRANEPNLPKGYLHSDVNRQERIKELGKFEMDYHNNTKGVFGKNISRSDFLQNNPSYYPHINPVISQPRFNKAIEYPRQQSPVRFNMERPGNFSPAKQGGTFPRQPIQGGGGGRRGR